MRISRIIANSAFILFFIAIFSGFIYFAIEAYEEICGKQNAPNYEYCTTYNAISLFFTHVHEFLKANHEPIIALATIAIAIFTWCLFYSTEKLWDAGERQLKHAKKSSRRELRAYVGIDELPADGKGNLRRDLRLVNGKVRAIAYGKNFGQTPAYEFTREVNLEYSPIHDKTFSFPAIRYGDKGLLHPGQDNFLDARTKNTFAQRKLTISKIDTTKGNTWRWHVYGFVSYRDVFGKRHFTKFCFWLSWNDGSDRAPGWYACKEHNETDDKPKKRKSSLSNRG